MKNRAGQVLPLAMVAVVLVSMGLYAHHFVASSEYSQVHQIAHAYQTTLVTDAANTELAQQQAQFAAEPAARRSPWAEEILKDLEQARVIGKQPGAPDGKEEKTYGKQHKFKFKAELPLAQRVAREGGLPDSFSVDVSVGPFRLVPSLAAAQFYAEPAFADEKKDLIAWNFRGPLTAEIRAGGQTERKTTTLAITDATPPANEFALMSYEPPVGADEAQVEERAINDLNHGGRFTVYARQQGRVMVRGPFYLLPEEATQDPASFLGGVTPEETMSYQERKWTNWSTIPGNRALIQPPLSSSAVLNTVVGWIHKIAPGIGSDAYEPVLRPEVHETPEWQLGPIPLWPILGPAGLALKLAGAAPDLGPWFPQVSVCFGLAISGEPTVSPGDWTSVVPHDQPGTFAPAAYFHGLLKPGEQTFSILGNPAKRGTGPEAETGEDIYRGIVWNPLEEGSQPKPYEGGLRPAPGKDFDVIVPEPLPRETGKVSDVGILGYYGVATFNSHSIVDMGIFELLSLLLGPEIKILDKLRELTGISPDLHVVLRSWDVKGFHFNHEEKLTLAKVMETFANAFPAEGESIEGKEEQSAVLSPYGLYFCAHDVHSKERVWTAIKALVALHVVNVGIGLLTDLGIEKIEKVVHKLFKKAPKPKGAGQEVEEGLDLAGLAKIKFQANQVLQGAYSKLYKAVFGKHIAKEAGDEFTKSVTRNLIEAALRVPLLNYVKVNLHTLSVGSGGFLPSIAKIFLGSFGYDQFKHPYAQDPRAAFTQLEGEAELVPDYANGFYPTKYTSWGSTFTRSYPTMESYIKNEAVDGVLPLRGCVLIRHLEYKGEPIRYRGAGIIVTVTDDAHRPPVLDARVEPAEEAEGNWLTLVHLVTQPVYFGHDMPSLALGELFTGTVFSQTGVKPAHEGTAILGNLVTGNINKHGIDEALKDPEQGVHVRYAVERLKDLNAADRRPMWTMEVTGAHEAPPPPVERH